MRGWRKWVEGDKVRGKKGKEGWRVIKNKGGLERKLVDVEGKCGDRSRAGAGVMGCWGQYRYQQ